MWARPDHDDNLFVKTSAPQDAIRPELSTKKRTVDIAIGVGPLMSAFGTKRTYRVAAHMSAFGGKADMAIASPVAISHSSRARNPKDRGPTTDQAKFSRHMSGPSVLSTLHQEWG